MCKYCEKLRFKGAQIEISAGAWSSVIMENIGNNQIVIFGESDEYTDRCIVEYCPFCGQKFSDMAIVDVNCKEYPGCKGCPLIKKYGQCPLLEKDLTKESEDK